ncbi:MAG: hypothetical protein U1E14_02530 [Geminicoccaceae bacterium]
MQERVDAAPQRIPRRTEHPAAVARRRRRRLRILLVLLAVLLAAPLFFAWNQPPTATEPPRIAEGPDPVPPESSDRSLLQATREQLLELIRPVAQ